MAKKRSKLAKKVKPKRAESPAPVEPRAPEIAEQPTTVETEKVLHLCVAENQICSKTLEIGRMFGPGQIVDLNETLSDGSKLRDHVRLACWRPIRAGGK